MKKSIKYAGIAAATLLAVAPVATPVLTQADAVHNGSTDAKANGYVSDAKALNEAVGKFNSKFNGTSEASDINKNLSADLGNVVLDSNSKMTYSDFMKSATARVVANTTNKPVTLGTVYNSNGDPIDADAIMSDPTTQTETTGAAANTRDIYVTAQVTYANNSTKNIHTAAELQAAVADNTVENIALTTHYTYTDASNTDKNATVTANIKNTDMAMTKLNVSFTTPYNVALNQTVTDSQIIDGTDFKMTDQDGNAVLASYAVPSDTYFTSAQAALNTDANGVASTDDVSSTQETTNTGVKLAPKFKTAGSYYQAIEVNIGTDSRVKNFMDSVIAHPEQNKLTINGTQFSDINTDNFKYNADLGTLTFARKIVVSSDASQWTYTKQSGVVTTKDGSNYYTLVNNSNEAVGNRALGKNSAWLTDQYRTNKDGVKQYRVATGEWIDANNVTFSDKATTPSDNSALTDIQNQNGTVTLDAPASFNYLLYTKSGELGNRALSGDSAWKVIQTAKDSKGRTYYRVSTTEWVMEGNGVHFTAE